MCLNTAEFCPQTMYITCFLGCFRSIGSIGHWHPLASIGIHWYLLQYPFLRIQRSPMILRVASAALGTIEVRVEPVEDRIERTSAERAENRIEPAETSTTSSVLLSFTRKWKKLCSTIQPSHYLRWSKMEKWFESRQLHIVHHSCTVAQIDLDTSVQFCFVGLSGRRQLWGACSAVLCPSCRRTLGVDVGLLAVYFPIFP